jgi:dUTP pyrophosphatase
VEIPARRDDASLPLPAYARAGDAGLDLCAAQPLTLQPGERGVMPTGLRLAIPEAHAGFILPRSGLALKHGITVLNAPGLIDAGYRGEIQVLLINHGAEPVTLERGERIAQLVVQPVAQARLVEKEGLPDSSRGEGRFGSTGT